VKVRRGRGEGEDWHEKRGATAQGRGHVANGALGFQGPKEMSRGIPGREQTKTGGGKEAREGDGEMEEGWECGIGAAGTN